MPTTGGDGTTGGVTSGTGGEGSGTTCGATSCEEPVEPVHIQCDVFAQDCPEGEKCAPWADNAGTSWNATKCVPVTGDGQPGDPCVAPEGPVGGLDDCAKGALCWDVAEENQGACIAMCSGTADVPICTDESTSCAMVNEGVLNICIPDCDPLAQDCLSNGLCIPFEDTFICVLEAQAVGLFEHCAFVNGCQQGLLCSEPSWAAECHPEAEGCCLPMCDLDDPEVVCPGVGQSCVSIYAPEMVPPKYANVGVCRIRE